MKTCPCNPQRFFSAVKIESFIGKILMFSIFVFKTLIVGTLINLRSTHNLSFGKKNMKNRYTLVNPSFTI